MAYSYSQLKALWTANGGNPAAADMAAAIALAESGGIPDNAGTNTNGTVDRGLWQINSVHGSLSTFDPNANAKAAILISANGVNWRPWCTAWSDGACGTQRGSYLGMGAPYQKYMQSGSSTPNPFGNTPSADSTVGATKTDPISNAVGKGVEAFGSAGDAVAGVAGGAVKAITSIPDFLKFVTSKGNWLRIGAVVLGALLIILGGWKLMPTGVQNAAGTAAKVAAVA